MIEYILLVLLLLTFITIYLHHKFPGKDPFYRVVQVYLFVVLFHVSNTLIWFYFFEDKRYVDWAAPFGLCYGPLFYFAYNASKGIPFTQKKIAFHAFPFVFFFVTYVLFVSFEGFRIGYETFYFFVLYTCIAISMVSYCLWGILYKGIEVNHEETSGLLSIRKLIANTGIIFLLYVLLLVVHLYLSLTGQISIGENSLVFTYSILLGVQCVAFRYTINRIRRNGVMKISEASQGVEQQHQVELNEEPAFYQKSSISKELISVYEAKLRQRIQDEIYLDPELTLDVLALELKIPKHHLTQILNLGIGQTFTEYINGFRIEYACALLKDPANLKTIEEVAYKSGFNSKTSFNRNFKKQMGCTPSQYRLNSK